MPWCSREFGFDTGHRVLKHESKCRYHHGHRYLAEVSVYAPELDSLGRVIDFGVVKEVVGGWIDANWDHNSVFHPEDPLLHLLTNDDDLSGGKKPYCFGLNPTAENMAEHLGVTLDQIFKQRSVERDEVIRVVHIKLWETPNCWVDWHHPDFRGVVVGDPDFKIPTRKEI